MPSMILEESTSQNVLEAGYTTPRKQMIPNITKQPHAPRRTKTCKKINFDL